MLYVEYIALIRYSGESKNVGMKTQISGFQELRKEDFLGKTQDILYSDGTNPYGTGVMNIWLCIYQNPQNLQHKQ